MKPFGFINEANHGKKKHKNKKHGNSDDTQISGQICVSPAEKTAKQHKTGPEPHQTKNTTNPWGLPPTR